MKKNRCLQMSLMLILVMAFSVVSVFALADTTSEGKQPNFNIVTDVELDNTFVQSATVQNSQEQVVADFANADPNEAYVLNLTVAQPDGSGSAEKQLPENTDSVRMFYQLENMIARDGENNDVSWSYDAAQKQIVFKWKNDKKAAFSASISIVPSYPENQNLTGSHILVNPNNVMLGARPYRDDMISSSEVVISNKKVRPWGDENPVYTFTHVTGDYYTIRSEVNGKYLRISKRNNRLYLEDANEETAQKILVKEVGNECYTFTYQGSAINNFNTNKRNGFGSWTLSSGKSNNEKFKLYDPSALDTAPSKDISGDKYIVQNGQKAVLTFKTVEGEDSLIPIKAFQNGSDWIPADDVHKWTFENVTRDWYTVRMTEGYLNINENGAYISQTPQNLMVAFNSDNSILLKTGEFNDNTNPVCFTLSLIGNNIANGFGSIKYANNVDTKFVLFDNLTYRPVEITGSMAITNNDKDNAALVAKTAPPTADGRGKLVSVNYLKTDEGEIYSQEDQIESWTFNHIEGNWYTIQAQDGRYLSVSGNGVALTSALTKIFVQERGGLYRFTDGSINALNYYRNEAAKGFGNYDKGNTTDNGEWMSLQSVMDPSQNVIQFNANGGTVSDLPGTLKGRAGDKVILPDLDGTKANARFIGWAEVSNLYAKAKDTNGRELNHDYHEVYKPGTAYSVKLGFTTLYAVWDSTDATQKKAKFAIRTDGVIQDEPNAYEESAYTGQFWINDIVDEGRWIIDIDGTKSTRDYYINNSVTANLKRMPTVDEINKALRDKKSSIVFDPETQYIHWYVLKHQNDGFHVDGVIRTKGLVGISYEMNVPENEKTAIDNMPGGYQVARGTEVLIGTEYNSTTVLTPERPGYVFKGWNTEKDGTGEDYNAGTYTRLKDNLHLYAQWVEIKEENMIIKIESEWPDGKPAYVGTENTLTAVLTGFEGKTYDLQWQHSIDLETWYNEPNANGETFTYVINEVTGEYHWRVIAYNVKDKED